LLGRITAAIEVMVALTVVYTVLFGGEARAERAFRLLRWIANEPEPPAPAAATTTASPAAPQTRS
jgi:hypothetical protein